MWYIYFFFLALHSKRCFCLGLFFFQDPFYFCSYPTWVEGVSWGVVRKQAANIDPIRVEGVSRGVVGSQAANIEPNRGPPAEDSPTLKSVRVQKMFFEYMNKNVMR